MRSRSPSFGWFVDCVEDSYHRGNNEARPKIDRTPRDGLTYMTGTLSCINADGYRKRDVLPLPYGFGKFGDETERV